MLWDDSAGRLQLGLKGWAWTPSLASLCLQMMQARTFSGTNHTFVAADVETEKRELLETLLERGVVACSHRGQGFTKWHFTVEGAKQLQVGHDVCNPTPVFTELQDEDISKDGLKDATAWELLSALERRGFQIRLCPRGSAMPLHQSHRPRKEVYLNTTQIFQKWPVRTKNVRTTKIFPFCGFRGHNFNLIQSDRINNRLPLSD